MPTKKHMENQKPMRTRILRHPNTTTTPDNRKQTQLLQPTHNTMDTNTIPTSIHNKPHNI